MRKLILTAAAALIFLLPSTAQADIVHADGAAGAAGHVLLWHVDYDTVTKDVVLDATYTKFDGSAPAALPSTANVVVIRANGQEQVFDLLTLTNPNDGQPGVLNDGPLTYSPPGGLRVSANRAASLDFRTELTP